VSTYGAAIFTKVIRLRTDSSSLPSALYCWRVSTALVNRYRESIFYQYRMERMHIPIFVLLVALLVVAVLSVVAAKLKPRDRALDKPWPLEAKRQLLSERERALYQRLIQSLPNHIVLAQVQLLQIINFQRGRRTHAILNRISQLSLDFLILNPDTSIVAAVELDDVTHTRENRRQADARKGHALQSAGVPLIRWNARNLPDASAILAALPAKTSATPAKS
jgi:very-short-patch-repair endonuclease